MAAKSRFIKPLNYPPPTPDMIRQSASRLINSRIHGHLNGVERRALARASADPVLREAARILDAYDAEILAARPLSVAAAQRSRAVEQAGNPSSRVGVTAADSASPAPRPQMQPSALRREINGRYLSHRSTKLFAGVRRFLQDLRESAKDGAS